MSRKTWEDGTNARKICRHYGYDYDEVNQWNVRYWPAQEMPENLDKLPEAIKQLEMIASAKRGRIRGVLDYDPDYPRGMIQFEVR